MKILPHLRKANKTSFLLRAIALVCCSICILPLLPSIHQKFSEESDICSTNSMVHKGIKSTMFRDSLIISLVLTLPMVLDVILDTIGLLSGFSANNMGLLARTGIIFTSLIGDLVTLVYVIPTGHSQLMWTVFLIQWTTRVCIIYDFLQLYGAPSWNSRLVLFKVIVFGIGQFSRMLSFVQFERQIYWSTLSFIIDCAFFLMIGNHFIRYSIFILKNHGIKHVSVDEFCCFKYISAMLCSSSISICIYLVLGPRAVCDLDDVYLSALRYQSTSFCFILAAFHNRRAKVSRIDSLLDALLHSC
jgi:hypothetical protein